MLLFQNLQQRKQRETCFNFEVYRVIEVSDFFVTLISDKFIALLYYR
jgi:hypothetical protein